MVISNILIPIQMLTSADSNTPSDMGNGWWNTTAGSDWIITSIGNLWIHKNISVTDSISIENGGELVLQNCTVIVNENVIIKNNATLELINTTLKFNGTIIGSSKLEVRSGGSLRISDFDNDPMTIDDASNITSNITDDKHRFLFTVSELSNLSILNSELHQCGNSTSLIKYGLYVKADNSIIENNTFSNNFAGLLVESSNNRINNNKFFDNDQFGLLVIDGGNNTLDNNTIWNNGFNFGLFVNDQVQNNNITKQNTINSKPLHYIEQLKDFRLHPGVAVPGFIGIANSTNITVLNQTLINNFNSMLIFNSNNSVIQNTSFNENKYGVIANNSRDISFIDCNFTNNEQIGLKLTSVCQNFEIKNSLFRNNSEALQIVNSNLTIINSTIDNSQTLDLNISGKSSVWAVNTTINLSKLQVLDESKLEQQVYLNVQTKNHKCAPIGNVQVEIYDGYNNLVFNRTSNAQGNLTWLPCTSCIITSSGLDTSICNYELRTKFHGFEFNQSIKMNISRDIIFTLNHPPSILNEPSELYLTDEDSFFNYDFNCIDNDSDIVTWHSETDANWLNPIGLYSGIINGTPTNADVGSYFLNISCNDSYSGFDFYNFTIQVNNINDPPIITSKFGAENAYEDFQYYHDFNVTDPDYLDSHEWSMVTDAGWLNPIHRLTGRLSGNPTKDDIGKYPVKITCKDTMGATDIFSFTLTVYPTNDPPIIINPEDVFVLIDEESTYYYDFNFFDEDSDSATWSLDTNASWLTEINSATGELTGIPHDHDVGRFYVNVTCTDFYDSFSYWNFTIEVLNTNDPPIFTNPSNQIFSAFEDKYFESIFLIYDPDKQDVLIFSMYIEEFDEFDTPADRQFQAAWLTLIMDQQDRTCTIFGTPENDDVGKLLVNLTCYDIFGVSASINFSIIVKNTNDAPEIINPENEYTYVREDFEYYYDFDFIDVDGDSVSWSMNTNAKWLREINSKTGELSGIPVQADLGIYYAEVFCQDSFGGIDSQNYTIQVNNTNNPPVISNPCPKIVYILEDKYYQYDFNAIDFDNTKVFWSRKTDASWLRPIKLYTGIISGTPDNSDVGQYYVNISCRDVHFDYTYWNYTIFVNNTNDQPIIIGQYIPTTANIDEEYFYTLQYYDPDGDQVTWKMETNASLWLKLDSENGILFGTPTRLNVGTYYINLTCADPSGGTDFYKFLFRVIGTRNRPPNLFNGYVHPAKGDTDTIFTFYVRYQDRDNDEPLGVTLKLDGAPIPMEQTSGDDLVIGVVFTYSTRLSEGIHSFYFQGVSDDELYTRAEVDDDAPSYQDPGTIEVSKKPTKEKISATEEYLQVLSILFMVAVILIIFSILLIKRKHRLFIGPIVTEDTLDLEEELIPEESSHMLKAEELVSKEPIESKAKPDESEKTEE